MEDRRTATTITSGHVNSDAAEKLSVWSSLLVEERVCQPPAAS